jgi:hypothetical protein
MATRRVLLLLAGGVLASSTGCIHVSQRAIDNGRAMTSSLQYYDVMSGNVNNASLKRLYYRSNARLMYQRDLPYAPFGHWTR